MLKLGLRGFTEAILVAAQPLQLSPYGPVISYWRLMELILLKALGLAVTYVLLYSWDKEVYPETRLF